MTDSFNAAPKTSSEESALELDSYVVHIKTNTCTHCSSGAEWSELYEVWVHPTKTRGSALHVLRKTQSIQPGYSLSHLRLPANPVPICSECIETYETPESTTRSTKSDSRQAWTETLRRKYAPEPRSEKASPTKPAPTLDML